MHINIAYICYVDLYSRFDDASWLAAILEMLHLRSYNVSTGGGPGIMEAANRGAHEAGAACENLFRQKVWALQVTQPWALVPADQSSSAQNLC